MTMTFDGLLRSIHPEVTLDRFEREANAAVLSMHAQHPVPRDARTLLLRLATLQHRMSLPVGDRTPFPAAFLERHARVVDRRLAAHFGGRRGIGVAFQIVQAKGATGYREVMDILANRHAHERTRLTVQRRVDRYWQTLGTQGRINAAKLYLARFSDYLAPDQRRRDPIRLATVLPRILYEHPYRLRDLLVSDRLRR